MVKEPHTLYRPPAEAGSLLVRVADGCPWNRCAFCGMYQGVRYRAYGMDEILAVIRENSRAWPDAQRVFLADGDVMAMPFPKLRRILAALAESLPELKRASVYANGCSIAGKTDSELRELKACGLHTLYMGLESGDDAVLELVNKHENAELMIESCRRAQDAGLRMSVMILIGLGGRERTGSHAAATARALNRMQPRLLSALRWIPVPGTMLGDRVAGGDFAMLSQSEATSELREIINGLELERTVFRADHSSNILRLQGRLRADKARLLDELDALLASGSLDADGPGEMPLWL